MKKPPSSPAHHDSLYARPLPQVGAFVFDASVADVFPDMINRSVPGYAEIINQIGVLAANHAQADTNLYDLGCSLGAATLAMRHSVTQPGCQVVAVDNAEAMVQRFEKILQRDTGQLPVQILCQDLQATRIENASVVVMNFTLQFIPLAQRHEVLQTIYNGLRPGGCLILSEKLSFADPQQQQLLTELHHAFKKANGYSELEIAQKRTALENVLIPETADTHLQRLQQCGFRQCLQWFQCHNFASFLAVK